MAITYIPYVYNKSTYFNAPITTLTWGDFLPKGLNSKSRFSVPLWLSGCRCCCCFYFLWPHGLDWCNLVSLNEHYYFGSIHRRAAVHQSKGCWTVCGRLTEETCIHIGHNRICNHNKGQSKKTTPHIYDCEYKCSTHTNTRLCLSECVWTLNFKSHTIAQNGIHGGCVGDKWVANSFQFA